MFKWIESGEYKRILETKGVHSSPWRQTQSKPINNKLWRDD